MDLYEAIEKRYSVRSYRDRPVEQDKLTRILEAGRLAPSARNRQEWKFVVVRDAATREALAEASGQAFLAQAPVVVAVVGLDPQRVMFCGQPADPIDCAIAIEHMALAATAEGLGSCWIGHFKQPECCRVLGVPSTAKIVEMLAIGYAADSAPPRSRKPMKEVVCYDKFQ